MIAHYEINKLVPQQRLERGFNKQVALIIDGRSGGYQLTAVCLLLEQGQVGKARLARPGWQGLN